MGEEAARPVAGGPTKRRQLAPPRVFASKSSIAPVGNDGPPSKIRPLSWAAPSSPDLSGDPKWCSQIGSRVCIGGAKTGILLYYGHTKFAEGVFCGVKLDEPLGKHDGSVQGHRYFTCPPGHGIFAPPHKVVFMTEETSGTSESHVDDTYGAEEVAAAMGRSRTPDLLPSRKSPEQTSLPVRRQTMAACSAEDCGRTVVRHYSLSGIRPPKSRTKLVEQPAPEILNSTVTLDELPSEGKDGPVPRCVQNDGNAEVESNEDVCEQTFVIGSEMSTLLPDVTGNGQTSPVSSNTTFVVDDDEQLEPGLAADKIQGNAIQEQFEDDGSGLDEAAGGRQWSVELDESLGILSPDQMKDFTVPTENTLAQTPSDEGIQEIVDDEVVDYVGDEESDQSSGALQELSMKIHGGAELAGLEHPGSVELWKQFCSPYLVADRFIKDESFPKVASNSTESNLTPSAERLGQFAELGSNLLKEDKPLVSEEVLVRDKLNAVAKAYSQEGQVCETSSLKSVHVLNLKCVESGVLPDAVLPDYKFSGENTRLASTALDSPGAHADAGSRAHLEAVQAMDKIFADKFSSLDASVKPLAKDALLEDVGGQPVDVAHLKEVATLSACMGSPKSTSFEIVTSPKHLFGSPMMAAIKPEPLASKTPPLLRDTHSAIAKVELQLKRQEILLEKSQGSREEAVSQLTSDGVVEYLMQQMGGNFVQQVTEGSSTMAVSVTSIDTGYQGDAECDMQSDSGTNAANTPIEDSSKEFNADIGKHLKGDAGSDSDFCSDMAASWTESDLELDDRVRGRGARIIDGRLYFSSSGKEVTVSTESLADDIRKAAGDSPKSAGGLRKDDIAANAPKLPEPSLPEPESGRLSVVITPESPASDDTLRCRDSVVSADSTSGGDTSLRGNAISEECLDQMFYPLPEDGQPEQARADTEEATNGKHIVPQQNGKAKVPQEGPAADAKPKEKTVSSTSSKSFNQKGKAKQPTPPKKETPPRKEPASKDARKIADAAKKTEKEAAKKLKTPKKNVMSKIKAMIEGASSKLTSSKEPGGSPGSSMDKEDAKKATRLPKKSRWDAVMSKIAAGQAEEKTKTKKEVASRVYSNLTPSKPGAPAKSPQVPRNAVKKKESPSAKAPITKPTKLSAKIEAAAPVNSKPRLKSLGTSSEATDLSINSHSEQSTSQLLSKKSKLLKPAGARPSSLPIARKGPSSHSVCSPQPSLASIGSRGSTLSQLTLASHSSAIPTRDYSMGSNLSAPTDRSRTGKPGASTGRRSPMPPPVAPTIARRGTAPHPPRGSRTSQRSSEGSRQPVQKVSTQPPLSSGRLTTRTVQASGPQASSKGSVRLARGSTAPARSSKDQSGQLRSLKASSGLVKSGPHPDLLHSSVTRSGSAREVSRLEALCEARTKELNFVRMQLKHCAAGFDSLAVLVQYLTHEVGAFSVPELRAHLLHMQEKFQATHSELEEAKLQQQCLQDEIAKLHQNHQNEFARREQEEHEKVALAEHQSEQIHREAIKALKISHQNDLEGLTTKHVDQLTSLKKLHEEQEKVWLDGHLDEIANLRQQHSIEQTDLVRVHEEQVYDLKVKYLDSEAALEQQIQQLTSQCEDLEKHHNAMQETFLSDNSDHRLQAYVTRCTSLGKEVDSLKVVLDMRLKELQDLRREKQEAEQQAEELILAREEIKKLVAKNEDLQEQITSKTASERYLLMENESLKENCEKKLEQSKRISMENEALHWRLRQSKEFSITLNPIEGSGDSSNGNGNSSLSYYWDNEGMGPSFSPIKTPAVSRPMSHPKGSSPHGSPRLSPSKPRQPSSAPGRPVSAPVYPKDNTAPARLRGLSTSEDEMQLEWDPQVSVKLREKPKRKLVRKGSHSDASTARSGSPPSAPLRRQNGHLAKPRQSSTPIDLSSIEQIREFDSKDQMPNVDLATTVQNLTSVFLDDFPDDEPSSIGHAEGEHQLPCFEEKPLALPSDDVPDCVVVGGASEQRTNQVTSTNNIELYLSRSKQLDDAALHEGSTCLRFSGPSESLEMPVLDIAESTHSEGVAESVGEAPQGRSVVEQFENYVKIVNDVNCTEIADLNGMSSEAAFAETLPGDVSRVQTIDQTATAMFSIPSIGAENPMLGGDPDNAAIIINDSEPQINGTCEQEINDIEVGPPEINDVEVGPPEINESRAASGALAESAPAPTESGISQEENGYSEVGPDCLEISDMLQTCEVEIETLDLGNTDGCATPQTCSVNADEDASRTSSSEELLDSASLESSLSAVAGKGSLADEVSYSRTTTSNGSSAPSPKKTTTLVITFRANRQSVSSSRSSSPVHHPGTPSASEASESQSVDSSPRASPVNEERITNKAIQLLENSLFAGMRSPRTSAGESMILDELPATPPPQVPDPAHVLLKKALQDQLLFGNGGSCGSSFRGSLESCAREASMDDSPLPGLSKPDTPESTSQAKVPTDSTNIDMSWSDDDMPSETEV